MALSMRTVSQNWLADFTGQLKTTYATLWDSGEAKPVLQNSFIMFCLDLFCWFTFLSTFQTALQTNFVTVSLFALSDFLWHLWQLTIVCLYIFICAPHQTAIALSSSSLLFWLLERRCHLFDCVPSPARKILFCHNSLSLSVKGSRTAARVVAKVEVTDCCCWPMIVSSSLGSVPLQKNVSTRVKCS